MIIRDYEDKDEAGWVRCRLLSFLDCSYFDDVRKTKETYEHPAICLVAEHNKQIVGLIDLEYEENDVRGATIWHLGVLPEYRGQGIAAKLWNTAKQILLKKGIRHFEVWTQDDIGSNKWYERQGFSLKEAYLNAFLRGIPQDERIKKYINLENLGDIYGIRCFNFEAPIERKAELSQFCYRLHEVRLYEQNCQ